MSKITTEKVIEPIQDEFSNLIKELDQQFPYEPGENVIKNILNYSKVLSVRKLKTGEYFEMLLN
jgi:hypothetical protein